MKKESFQATIQNIRLFLISPSPMNPRKSFDEEALKELAANIAKQGLLQPITVRPTEWDDWVEDGDIISIPARYEIVCGERRYRACSLLQQETIPCIVREMTDEEALDAMITENLQRKDVDPVEEAVAFNLLAQRGQTTEELALRFGKSEKYVRDRMRLSSLIPQLQKSLSIGQLPLGGANLLSRLSTEAQQEFFEEELDAGYELQTSRRDVEDWLDSYFMNLVRSPFQDGDSLKETWNPNGKLIRRCLTCECNTCNHGCLFVDMKTEEPQCTDPVCFDRKTDIYYDWFVRQYDSRITRKGQAIASGDVVICEGYAYGNSDKKRQEDIIEKLSLHGYRVFKESELGARYYGGTKTLKDDLKTGKVVECIDLTDIINRRRIGITYRCLPSSKRIKSSSSTDPSFMVASLCERSAAIEASANKKITKLAKESLNTEAYINRESELRPWEMDIISAIVFDMVPWTEQDLLIPGTRNNHASYSQIHDFLQGRNNSWMRRAIVSFMMNEHKQPFLVKVASELSAKTQADIERVRMDTDKRIDVINDELREMGYDEKGIKL